MKQEISQSGPVCKRNIISAFTTSFTKIDHLIYFTLYVKEFEIVFN